MSKPLKLSRLDKLALVMLSVVIAGILNGIIASRRPPLSEIYTDSMVFGDISDWPKSVLMGDPLINGGMAGLLFALSLFGGRLLYRKLTARHVMASFILPGATGVAMTVGGLLGAGASLDDSWYFGIEVGMASALFCFLFGLLVFAVLWALDTSLRDRQASSRPGSRL